MAPKDTELYDLLGVKPEATDIEYVYHISGQRGRSKLIHQTKEGIS